MKVLVLAALLLTACGVKENKTQATENNLALFNSATWCEEKPNQEGFVETYRFYKDGRTAKGKWHVQKQEFSGGFQLMTWKISGEFLTFSAKDQVPQDKVYKFEFLNIQNKGVIRLLENNKTGSFLLEQCKLARDPR